MFERFTEKAIKVILLAEKEACRLGHDFVGTESIFLGLIGEGTGVAAQILKNHGVKLKDARIEVEKILGKGSGMITVDIPFTQSAIMVLENALSFAEQLRSESINTEHLLIGIFQEGESTARILQNLRVNPQDLAISLSQYLQQQPSNQLPQAVYVLLYNAGTDNEGIHTIGHQESHQERNTVLMFESSVDASYFVECLRELNFSAPTVEIEDIEIIKSFCRESGFYWEFVPEGTNKIPPIEREVIDRQKEYFTFLNELLQAEHESNDPQIVHLILQNNLDKLNFYCFRMLKEWARGLFSQGSSEYKQLLAGVLENLCIDIKDFPRGNSSHNIEIAITGFEIVLEVRPREIIPQKWAMTQNNLGTAYGKRIKGNKAKNLETAIDCFKSALEVYTQDKFPYDWAMTQNNLAVTYFDSIQSNRSENLEKAIIAHNEVLKVRTFDAFPRQWANTKHDLGNVYQERIKGDKADNLERAIKAYKEALKVRNINDFPIDWAMTTTNLAGAYSDRIRGDKAKNLEEAIFAYEDTLRIRTYDDFPRQWAMTQHNLAMIYLERIFGDKAENIEMVINYCQNALQVMTLHKYPEDWAMTQNVLGNAYSKRIKEDRSKNLEQAISAYMESLKVMTFNDFPIDWAMIQNNLGVAFHEGIKGDKVENMEKVIEFYNNALKIRTKENDPLNCLQTAENLGKLYYEKKEWQPAIESYNIAIEAIENIRLEAFNPQRRQEILADRIEIFHRIVLAHLKLNQPEKALEHIERSKARNLVELMTQKNLQPQGVDQAIIDKLNELKQKVVNEQIRLQHQSINQNRIQDDSLTPYVQDQSFLKEYQQALDTFIRDEINQFDSKFSLTQNGESIGFKDIQSLTDDETCLLQWYITVEKILAFVVSNDGSINYWESSENDLDRFLDDFKNHGILYYSENGKQEWRNQLPNLLQTFADTLHINDILALIPNNCKRLIIIPHYFLHILPIHAFPINEEQILQDKYDVQYAPSCQLLQITKQRQLNELTNLFAIQNPTKDLHFTDLEVNIISTLFNQSEIIAEDNATKDTVTTHIKASDSHCYHFSCHGGFNPNNPLESALFLANKEPLTLGEIFELNFKKSRLVVLSACETGLIDLNSISDEYIGLPSGFLFAGSPSVVSSLWTVDDLSTSFLMMKFYEILLDETQDVSVPVALKIAQNWLRNLTIEEFDRLLVKYKPEIDQVLIELTPGKKRIIEKQIELTGQRGKYPFANPYYWAAFLASGV